MDFYKFLWILGSVQLFMKNWPYIPPYRYVASFTSLDVFSASAGPKSASLISVNLHAKLQEETRFYLSSGSRSHI